MKKYIIVFLIIMISSLSVSLKDEMTLPTFKESKKIALTFDDGPNERTEKLLDGLKERDVKATFFVLGVNALEHKEIIKRMYLDGHSIGNHTYSHKNLLKLTNEDILYEIEYTNFIIEDITGETPILFRPSYGNYNENIQNIANMEIISWTVDSMDWKLQNTKKIYNRVINDIEENDIILMHDIYKTSVDAALKIIDELKRQGYTFVTVDELLGIDTQFIE